MKYSRIFVRLAIVSAISLAPGLGFAASSTTTSTATVIEPIAITTATDLVFGDFAPGGGGSVTVATNGARTASGPILSTAGATPTAAKFDVTGNANSTYSISTSAAASLSDSAATPNTMALTVFSDLTGGGATTGTASSGTLSAGGTESIYLGGELTVGGTQAAGTYTGDVTVTVEYN